MNKYKPFVSLLLPNYNNEPVIDLFFEKLIKATTYKEYELVVVDDGSIDNSISLLKKWKEKKIIKNFTLIEKKHSGVVDTLNIGLKALKGEIIVRLDGDATIETPYWIEKMLNFFLSHSAIGCIVGKIIFFNGIIHSLGRSIISEEGMHDIGAEVLEPIGKRTFDSIVKRKQYIGDSETITEIDSCLGCITMFYAEDAIKLNGWDTGYSPVWIEDDDFGFSIRAKLNKKVFYYPDVTVCHRTNLRNSRNPKSFAQVRSFRKKLKNIGEKIIGENRINAFKKLIRNNQPAEVDPWRRAILTKNYRYWEKKWGFHPLNPIMEKIFSDEKFKNTEVLWRYKSNGITEEILENYYRYLYKGE